MIEEALAKSGDGEVQTVVVNAIENNDDVEEDENGDTDI